MKGSAMVIKEAPAQTRFQRTRLRRITRIVGCLLILLGLGLTVRQVGYLRWPSVEAEVSEARVVQRSAHDAPGRPDYPIFRPKVTYRYRSSTGESREATILADRWAKSAAEAQRFLDRYPVGSEPRISSNPHDPDQVRFDVGVNVATLWQPLLAFAGATLCLLLSRRRARGLSQA